MKHNLRRLRVEPLTKRAFRTFGEVLQMTHARARSINDGFAMRYHDLARIDVMREGGRPTVSLFRATRRPEPLVIDMLEQHPLGSQAFFPLSPDDWLVVVAEGHEAPDAQTLRCFRAGKGQGINFAAGTWHFPVLVLAVAQDFIVIDRKGPGVNLNVHRFAIGERALIEGLLLS